MRAIAGLALTALAAGAAAQVDSVAERLFQLRLEGKGAATAPAKVEADHLAIISEETTDKQRGQICKGLVRVLANAGLKEPKKIELYAEKGLECG